MKIVIIGGNRFVGKLLAQRLSSLTTVNNNIADVSVILINRTGTGPDNCILIKCDRNTEEFKQQLKSLKADIIIDMCLYNLNQYNSIEPLLKQSNLKKYIFISSIASKIKSFGSYGIQKQLLEDKIKKSTLPYIILQPTYIIGKEDHSNRLSQYINNLITGNKLSVDGTGNKLINFVDAEDVCNIILKLINSSLMHKEYEIGCNEITSINDLIYRLSNIMNVTPKLHFYANNSPYADIKCFAVNFNIKRDINYNFINFNDTLEKIYSNYENRN
tara:strand:+ start:1265 stop:2083 length:819 start_codon:yes stop_codon:yes gene_type:complete